MHINEKALDGDHDLLKQKVGILVFGLRQWMAFNDQKYWSWLNYAYQMWVGQRFTNLPDFFNPYDLSPFQERYLIPRPFLGLEAGGVIPEGLTTDPEMAIMLKKVHGYGMVSFIKYIETERKIAEVKKLWNTFNPRSPMAAIFSAFDKSESSWWPDYSAKYVQGDIYNITDKTMLNTIHKDNVFTISKDTDTLKCFDDRYQDLSSALYRVDLKYDQIDSLVFTLGPPGLNLDYVTFHIFKLRNEMFEYVGQGIQGDEYIELVVKKIPDLMSAGYHSLVALVVNSANESPYTGTLDIEFEVSSRQKVHRECRMTFWNFKYDDSFEDPSHNISTRTNQPLQYKMYDSVTGELRDNVYTASWQNKHDLWSPNSSSGNMRIDFNFNNQIITKFYFKVISEQKGITKKELTIEAVDIPYQGEDPIIKGWDWYKIVGEAIKTDHITQLTFVHTDYNFAGEWISTLTDFHTQDNSYIYIYMQ